MTTPRRQPNIFTLTHNVISQCEKFKYEPSTAKNIKHAVFSFFSREEKGEVHRDKVKIAHLFQEKIKEISNNSDMSSAEKTIACLKCIQATLDFVRASLLEHGATDFKFTPFFGSYTENDKVVEVTPGNFQTTSGKTVSETPEYVTLQITNKDSGDFEEKLLTVSDKLIREVKEYNKSADQKEQVDPRFIENFTKEYTSSTYCSYISGYDDSGLTYGKNNKTFQTIKTHYGKCPNAENCYETAHLKELTEKAKQKAETILMLNTAKKEIKNEKIKEPNEPIDYEATKNKKEEEKKDESLTRQKRIS